MQWRGSQARGNPAAVSALLLLFNPTLGFACRRPNHLSTRRVEKKKKKNKTGSQDGSVSPFSRERGNKGEVGREGDAPMRE